MTDVTPSSGTGRPTIGYGIAMAAAMVGFVCLAIAIDGTRRAAAGGNGLDALSGAGVPALIVAWAVALFARLAYFKKVSPANQARVRQALRALMAAEILLAIWGSWYVLGSATAPGELRGILIFGVLLQIGTALWIVRFSRP